MLGVGASVTAAGRSFDDSTGVWLTSSSYGRLSRLRWSKGETENVSEMFFLIIH